MATVGPQPGAPPLQLPDNGQDSNSMSWEGDRMFNIYIYDYCNKRGFSKTARELVQEADIPPESSPPINAKQGLLFEWWSVFWVLFTAKSNGNGTEDAMLYTRHMTEQNLQRQPGVRVNTGPVIPPPPPSRNQFPPQRQPNGIPNGVTPNGASHAPQPYPQPAPSQPNGVSMPQSIQMTGRPAIPGVPGIGQRPGVNGAGPSNFASPTMAHSPAAPGQNRGMPPPGAPQPPASAQQFGTRPPSRSHTPGSQAHTPAMIPQQSPSMMARQMPGIAQYPPPVELNAEFSKIPQQLLPSVKQEAGVQDKPTEHMTPDEKIKVITVWRRRSGTAMKPGMPPNAMAGPSGMNPAMMAQPRHPMQGQPPQQAQAAMAAAQQRVVKRNSTSPPDESMDGQQGASPPDRKRPRRSPNVPEGQPMVPFPGPPLAGPQPGMQGAPHQGMPNGGMRQPQMMPNGYPVGMNMGPPPGANGMMNAPVGGIPGPMVQTVAVAREQYRQSMQNMHKLGMPPTGSPAGDPSAFASPFPGQPNNRQGQQQQQQQQQQQMQQQPKQIGSMQPPPSPMGGIKGEATASPRHQPPGTPTTRNAATPVPPQQTMSAPSPSQILGTQPPTMVQPSLSSDIAFPDLDFSLDNFDPNMFRTDAGDLNFERDFGQWFNPEDTGLDLSK